MTYCARSFSYQALWVNGLQEATLMIGIVFNECLHCKRLQQVSFWCGYIVRVDGCFNRRIVDTLKPLVAEELNLLKAEHWL